MNRKNTNRIPFVNMNQTKSIHRNRNPITMGKREFMLFREMTDITNSF